MTNFINPDYPIEHCGIARLQSAAAAMKQIGANFRGAKGLVAMLLAGAASALVVVADQVISTWADGQLLLAWVAMWALVFGVLALFADASRGWSASATKFFESWARTRAERANDERTWAVAQSDPRFMADIQAARLRTERAALEAGEPLPEWPFFHMPSQRMAQYKPF